MKDALQVGDLRRWSDGDGYLFIIVDIYFFGGPVYFHRNVCELFWNNEIHTIGAEYVLSNSEILK